MVWWRGSGACRAEASSREAMPHPLADLRDGGVGRGGVPAVTEHRVQWNAEYATRFALGVAEFPGIGDGAALRFKLIQPPQRPRGVPQPLGVQRAHLALALPRRLRAGAGLAEVFVQ